MNIVKNIEPGFLDEYTKMESYREALQKFRGDDIGRNYSDGIVDDYFNIKKLVEDIGLFVLEAEHEAQLIKKLEFDAEGDYEKEELYFKRLPILSYRQYTYKALFFLAYTTYENRLFDFARLLNEYVDLANPQKINVDSFRKECIIYIENLLMDPESGEKLIVKKLFPDIDNYAEVRNALSHRKGLRKMKGDFEGWVNKTEGLSLTKNEIEEEVIKITKSEFVITYLKKVKILFERLTYAGDEIAHTMV